jgi:hypothetical protein
MKTKHAFLIFLIGFLTNVIGSFLKIVHFSNANLFLAIGSTIEIIGGLLILYKLFTYPKFRDFMNW